MQITRETRNHYAGERTASIQRATALMIDSPLSATIANFFMGLNKPLTRGPEAIPHPRKLQPNWQCNSTSRCRSTYWQCRPSAARIRWRNRKSLLHCATGAFVPIVAATCKVSWRRERCSARLLLPGARTVYGTIEDRARRQDSPERGSGGDSDSGDLDTRSRGARSRESLQGIREGFGYGVRLEEAP